jgi:hypothetical protein
LGSPNLSNVNQIEIHNDTWGNGFTIYFDGLGFADGAFTDNRAPHLSISYPNEGATVNTATTVKVDAFDEAGLWNVDFYVDGNFQETDSLYPYTFLFNPSNFSSGQHVITAKAYDASGNSSTSVGVTINPNDTIAPSIPTGLTAQVLSSNQINLTWNSSTDNISVADYDIYRDGSKVGSSATTSFTDSGLSPGTTYSYNITAKDTSGNVSSFSNTVWATTDVVAANDTTNPTVLISTPTSGAELSGTSTISINASDNISVSTVELYIDGAFQNSKSTSPFDFSLDTTQFSNSSHTLLIKAYDPSGNIGTATVTITIRNIVADNSPPYLSPQTYLTPYATPAGGTAAIKTGDLNNDGFVNIRDLSILLSKWRTKGGIADINSDGDVNIRDLSILLSRWGK